MKIRTGQVVQDVKTWDWLAEIYENGEYQGSLPALNREAAEEKLRDWILSSDTDN